MKGLKEKVYLFSFLSVMTLSLVACDAKEDEEIVSKKFAAENINEIYVKTAGQNIKLHSTTEKDIKVDIGGVKDAKVKEDGEKLEVITENSSSIVNLKTATVHVYLPEKIYKKIDVKTESGEVVGENIASKQLDLYSDSSDMTIKNYKGENIKGVSKSGEITLQGVEGTFDIQNNTGEVNVSTVSELRGKSQIKTESSNININFKKEPRNLEVDLSTRAGQIKNDFSLSSDKQGNDHSVKGRIGNGKENDIKLTVQSMTGKIELKHDE
ncbi:DUF4097 family beta strand repeat-containing protein [Bacillus gaemokensis]|uniref:DUF4097 domain-containing protein n=1 Tax=Bacillus gaemokensis TaxID=574375 RepID=A0A073K904_9BACI|nr:DUF4097 family beta strand repeat-containing protein [Bacillus gaemokensis]KEK22996.1 hypothetical protein BAGA_15100 [Bacillus gaemokensis]KYG37508.1 hypothetical protein AZF08_23545 [Bacillus gaemokensis]